MIIYAGLSRRSQAMPPVRWGVGLDHDFVIYLIFGLRRALEGSYPVDIDLISGRRSYAKQAALYRSNPSKAARPGLSQHEYGYAVDLRIILPPRSPRLYALLQVFGIPIEGTADLGQAIISALFSDILNVRGREDPGHVAFYSDTEWHQALAEAGYFGGGDVTPQFISLAPVDDPNIIAGKPLLPGFGW